MTVNNVIECYIFIRNMNQHFRNKARYHVEREERHGFKKLIMKTAVSRLELTMGGGGVPRALDSVKPFYNDTSNYTRTQ